MATVASCAPSLALSLAWLSLACGPRPGEGVAPGVLVIAIDALRADHVSAYGYDRDTTPSLRQLAREGLRFEQVFASAPLLVPAHAAILTGCEPGVARRFLSKDFDGPSERRWSIPARAPHLAVEFLTAGWATAAFVDHEFLAPAHGFALGFQRYEVLDPAEAEPWEGAPSTRAIDHLLKWVAGLPSSRPWFAYLHLNQLERFWSEPGVGAEGYFQPRPELSQIPPVANSDSVFFAIPRSRWKSGVRSLGQYEAAYDDEIRALDGEIGRLCASLRRQGRYDATSLHVLGTFGIQFGEAGLILCSGRYSPADLGVPWIVRPRAGLGGTPGRTVAGLVSTLDVAPSLLELEALGIAPGMSGSSQAGAVRTAGASAAARPFVFASCGLQEGCAVIGARHILEYVFPCGPDDAQLRRSWTGEWSDLTLQPRVSFYDRLVTPFPPQESEEILGGTPELASYRRAAVDWMRATYEQRVSLQGAGPAQAAEADPPARRDAGLGGAARR